MSYETVAIRSHGWEAQIAPTYGANPVSLQYHGQDILVPWSEDIRDPFLIGAPLLLPANRTAGGKFVFGGKEYTLPVNDGFRCANLHGDLYHQTFRVTERQEDQLTLCYENTGDIFPFPFRIRVTYQVGQRGFLSAYTIENPSEDPMPLSFGLHTTFREPDWFSVPLDSCQEKDSRHIPTGRYIPLNAQEQLYRTGSKSCGMAISGFYRSAGNTAYIGKDIRYQVTGFDHWILYNGGGSGGYLCVEPQLGGVNALNDRNHCPLIPGKGAVHLETLIALSDCTDFR